MLEGEISQINLIERLVELWREQFTGAIRFENDGIIKIIYFKGGDVLSASTNDRADSIDEILMRAGKVSREHVKQALARRKESETLGDAMLNLGYITRKELTWARRVQVVGVIRSIAAWSAGSFTIVADYLPKRDEGTLFPLPQILVELIVTEQDRQKFERELDGGSAVFSKAGDFDEVFGRLGLNEDAEAIVAQVDGTRSASEVASSSGKDAFNVYKLLHALATLGILRKPQASLEFSFATEDIAADASDAWDLQETPTFELDETAAAAQPTLEMPSMTFDADETAALSSPLNGTRSAWDEEEDETALAPPPPMSSGATTQAAAMPSWDTPPPAAVAPVPVNVEPPAAASKEQWGFDEAQLETAQRAAAPAPIPPPVYGAKRSGNNTPMRPVVKSGGGKRTAFLIVLLLLALLGVGGYYGWKWWQDRQAAETQVAQTQPVAPPPAPVKSDTMGTIVEAPTVTTDTAATTATTATAIEPTTTTMSAAPMNITATAPATQPPATTTTSAPPPATTTAPAAVQPLPVVVPKTTTPAGDTRLDQMARDFAANPQGNFTVQVQILCTPANVEQAMRQGGGQVWFVPQSIKGRSCYRVFYGHYQTREEATVGLGRVPSALRDPNMAVKPVPR